MSLDKPLELITEGDVQALKTDGVSERKRIEYKSSLPGNTYDEKKEFLADISSFANASGGHLILGINEDAGIPVDLCGVGDIDPDAEILRLENMIRDNIEPRIPSISILPVPLQDSRLVIIIRIPHSWAQPHVVNYRGHWRFYSRNSVGKYPLEVSEVRAAFALSETVAERIRLFRTERLGKIIADETPVSLVKTVKTVLHLIPFGAFDPLINFDVTSFEEEDIWRFKPMDSRITGYRYNLDGILTYSQPDTSIARSYTKNGHKFSF